MSDSDSTTWFCKKCQRETAHYKCGTCKQCEKVRSAARRKTNQERVKALSVDLPSKNSAKQPRSASKSERDKAYYAAWLARNPELSKARSAAWRAKNPDKAKENRKAWRESNPEATKVHNQNRRALRVGNGGVLSKGLSDKLFALQRGKCACCGQPLGERFHLDHIMPLALGGSNTDDNIQLLRQRCNNQKHAKHPVDFMQSRGFLL